MCYCEAKLSQFVHCVKIDMDHQKEIRFIGCGPTQELGLPEENNQGPVRSFS